MGEWTLQGYVNGFTRSDIWLICDTISSMPMFIGTMFSNQLLDFCNCLLPIGNLQRELLPIIGLRLDLF